MQMSLTRKRKVNKRNKCISNAVKFFFIGILGVCIGILAVEIGWTNRNIKTEDIADSIHVTKPNEGEKKLSFIDLAESKSFDIYKTEFGKRFRNNLRSMNHVSFSCSINETKMGQKGPEPVSLYVCSEDNTKENVILFCMTRTYYNYIQNSIVCDEHAHNHAIRKIIGCDSQGVCFVSDIQKGDLIESFIREDYKQEVLRNESSLFF